MYTNEIRYNLTVQDPTRDVSLNFENILIPVHEDAAATIDFDRLLTSLVEYSPEFTSTFGVGFSASVWNDVTGKFEAVRVAGEAGAQKCVALAIGDFRNSERIILHVRDGHAQPKPRKKRVMSKEKRIKERGIQDVIDLVAQWRQLHTESAGRLNLDQVAKMVHVSRKTLDDYSLQLRRATELGFDFAAHSDKKMGHLRNFIKKHAADGHKGAYACVKNQPADDTENDDTLSSAENNEGHTQAATNVPFHMKQSVSATTSRTADTAYQTPTLGPVDQHKGVVITVTPSCAPVSGQTHANDMCNSSTTSHDVDDYIDLAERHPGAQAQCQMLSWSFNSQFAFQPF